MERGIYQYVSYAIHYHTYKDLVAVYDMSFAFDCPDTEESFYAVHICNTVSPAYVMLSYVLYMNNLCTILIIFWYIY